jgi:hypothetical protein
MAGCFDSSPGPRSDKELMMAYLTSPRPQIAMATLCLSASQAPKPENILKTKDRKGAFSLTKPENILKKSQLLKSIEIPRSMTI